jgi:hypothetical protein
MEWEEDGDVCHLMSDRRVQLRSPLLLRLGRCCNQGRRGPLSIAVQFKTSHRLLNRKSGIALGISTRWNSRLMSQYLDSSTCSEDCCGGSGVVHYCRSTSARKSSHWDALAAASKRWVARLAGLGMHCSSGEAECSGMMMISPPDVSGRVASFLAQQDTPASHAQLGTYIRSSLQCQHWNRRDLQK